MWGAVEGSRREPSSEAETTPQSEESVDGPHRVGGPRVWASLSPFFLPDRKEAMGLRGPSCLNMCLRFKAILVPRLGCP